MTRFAVAVHAVVAVLAVAMTSSLASAEPIVATPTDYVFTFRGDCSDCIVDETHPTGGPGGIGTAALHLKDYVLGAALSAANFVDFIYTSEKLGVLDADSLSSIRGSFLTTDPAPTTFSIEFRVGQGLYVFGSFPNGVWSIGSASILDFGTNGIYEGRLPTEVPEPASLGLLAAALIGIAGARRRQR